MLCLAPEEGLGVTEGGAGDGTPEVVGNGEGPSFPPPERSPTSRTPTRTAEVPPNRLAMDTSRAHTTKPTIQMMRRSSPFPRPTSTSGTIFDAARRRASPKVETLPR